MQITVAKQTRLPCWTALSQPTWISTFSRVALVFEISSKTPWKEGTGCPEPSSHRQLSGSERASAAASEASVVARASAGFATAVVALVGARAPLTRTLASASDEKIPSTAAAKRTDARIFSRHLMLGRRSERPFILRSPMSLDVCVC